MFCRTLYTALASVWPAFMIARTLRATPLHPAGMTDDEEHALAGLMGLAEAPQQVLPVAASITVDAAITEQQQQPHSAAAAHLMTSLCAVGSASRSTSPGTVAAGAAQAPQQSGAAGQAVPTLEETQGVDLLLGFATATAEQQQQPQPGAAAAEPATSLQAAVGTSPSAIADAATANAPQAPQQSGAAGQAVPTLEETQGVDLLLGLTRGAPSAAEQQQQPQPGAAAAADKQTVCLQAAVGTTASASADNATADAAQAPQQPRAAGQAVPAVEGGAGAAAQAEAMELDEQAGITQGAAGGAVQQQQPHLAAAAAPLLPVYADYSAQGSAGPSAFVEAAVQATLASADEAAAQAGQVAAPTSGVLLQLRAAEATAIASCTRGICVDTTDPGAAASHAAAHIEAALQACNAAVHTWASTHLRGLPAGHPAAGAAGAAPQRWPAAAGPSAPAAAQAEDQGRCGRKRPRQAAEAASAGTAAIPAAAEAGTRPSKRHRVGG